jgi:hypothetical protein
MNRWTDALRDELMDAQMDGWIDRGQVDNRQRGGQKDELVIHSKVNGWIDRLIDRHKDKQIDELNNS